MHIIAVAWLYVVVLMALTEPGPLSGMLFLLVAIAPLALLGYLAGARRRRRLQSQRDNASRG